MNKTAGFIILAVLVIVAGVVVVMNMNGPATDVSSDDTTQTVEESPTTVSEASSSPIAQSSSPTADTSNNIVTITSSGYSPSILTVKSGTTVTFKNESGRGVWIASDPHPSHTNLPGFDADKAVANGSSYTYTFTKTGSWGYHDHLNSSKVGTIVVQ